MQGKDRDSIIELVMEVSGVKGIVHDAMKMLKSTELPELDLAMNENAKKSAQMVQDIQKSYNRKQKKEMKNSGFTLLDPKQMEKLMTDQGIAGRDDLFNLKEYAMLSMLERREMVWDMVRNIAFGVSGMVGVLTNIRFYVPILAESQLNTPCETSVFSLGSSCSESNSSFANPIHSYLRSQCAGSHGKCSTTELH